MAGATLARSFSLSPHLQSLCVCVIHLCSRHTKSMVRERAITGARDEGKGGVVCAAREEGNERKRKESLHHQDRSLNNSSGCGRSRREREKETRGVSHKKVL